MTLENFNNLLISNQNINTVEMLQKIPFIFLTKLGKIDNFFPHYSCLISFIKKNNYTIMKLLLRNYLMKSLLKYFKIIQFKKICV